jgi:hypothetical protein
VLLCIIGAVRVFIFNAAFPLFHNVDEPCHFDLVWKYSKGLLPCCAIENLSKDTAEFWMLYGTQEYLLMPENAADALFSPPAWKTPNIQKSEQFSSAVSVLQQIKNPETWSFPVYYAVAGLWCAIGRTLGIAGGSLLYWIRFLNVPLFAVLVWVSYLVAKTFFPNDMLFRIGLPLMVAFFPQDLFYSISNDSFTPLLFAVAFFMLLQVFLENKSYRYHLLAGLAVAATVLTKISNVTILLPAGIIIFLKTKQCLLKKNLANLFPLVLLSAAAIMPVGLWCLRNYITFGSLTGVAETLECNTWTVKPLNEIWNHPIFTTEGLSHFLTELAKTFWRGEIVWYRQTIASPAADFFYVISTAVFITVSGAGLLLNRNEARKQKEFALQMSFLVITASVLLLAALSTRYDFGKCPSPSQNNPFFTTGRLISGVLIPFLLVYLNGLGKLFPKSVNRILPLLAVAIIAVVITCSEFLLSIDVFKSQYNWFHLK